MASGVTPNRQAMARRSSARMVIIRPLKSWRWTWIMLQEAAQQVALGAAHRVQLGQVDGDLLMTVPRPQLAPGPGRALGLAVAAFTALTGRTPAVGVVVLGEELVDRDVVELGQALQPRHRDGALAPFVGAQHRRLELLIRHGLDGLQGEAHLLAHGAQARPHRSRHTRRVAVSSCSSSSGTTVWLHHDHQNPRCLRSCAANCLPTTTPRQPLHEPVRPPRRPAGAQGVPANCYPASVAHSAW